MADHDKPRLVDPYADWPTLLKARLDAIMCWLDGGTETNVPPGSKRWNAGGWLEKWTGTAWQQLDFKKLTIAGIELSALTSFGRSLFGVADAAAARTLLEISDGLPTGTVFYYAGNTAPPGSFKANGAAVSRTAYANLFAVIGTTYGAGDGSTTFNLPDVRAEFLRGLDDGRGIDPGRLLGSLQADQNASHTHTATTAAAGSHNHAGTTGQSGNHTHTYNGTIAGSGAVAQGSNIQNAGSSSNTGAAGNHTHTFTTDTEAAHTHTVTVNAAGGSESRPRNVAMLVCIKY